MKDLNIELISILSKSGRLRWTNHIEIKLLQRNISTSEVEYALQNCEIIEYYPEAYPYPACLVLGITINNKYIHIVCGASDIELWLITAYYPDIEEWESDFKTRKGR